MVKDEGDDGTEAPGGARTSPRVAASPRSQAPALSRRRLRRAEQSRRRPFSRESDRRGRLTKAAGAHNQRRLRRTSPQRADVRAARPEQLLRGRLIDVARPVGDFHFRAPGGTLRRRVSQSVAAFSGA